MAANDVPCCETMFWVYLVICVALVCFAGLMSGLTLGLMSLSLVDLEVHSSTSNTSAHHKIKSMATKQPPGNVIPAVAADVVWERMIPRILFNVGVPLVIGFALLRGFDVLIEQEVWSVPKWVPFLTTLITFGTSALGIAFGSLSTSLDAEKEGSFLGFEQVEKNWEEMWNEEDDR